MILRRQEGCDKEYNQYVEETDDDPARVTSRALV
jgi:hypothetical protein